jgi:hypothetical protein
MKVRTLKIGSEFPYLCEWSIFREPDARLLIEYFHNAIHNLGRFFSYVAKVWIFKTVSRFDMLFVFSEFRDLLSLERRKLLMTHSLVLWYS